MAEYLIQGKTLDEIAHAINEKGGWQNIYRADEMAEAIESIPTGGGGIIPTGTKQISITQNGTTTEDVTRYANAEITVNVPSGGAALPSIISKIDGGSFTFASNTISTYGISHSLGTTPKGFVIWTEEIDLANAGNNTIIRGVFVVDKTVNSETSYLYQMIVYNHGFNNFARSVGPSYSGYANTSTISYNVDNVGYAPGINYKWFAWA